LKQLGRVTAVLLLVILVLGGAVAITYVSLDGQVSSQSSVIQGQSSTIKGQSSIIQSQSSALASSATKLTSLEANITTMMKQLRSDDVQMTNLTSAIAADKAMITAIEAGYSQANSTISTLNASVGPLQAQVTSLQTQLANLNSTVSGIDSQLSSLKAQVAQLTAITSLGMQLDVVNEQFVSVPAIGNQVAATFVANYSGYVSVSMSSISNIGDVQAGVLILFGSNVNSGQYSSEPVGPFSFSTIPDVLTFPVTPGSISVYLTNSSPTAQNATISVTYYY
jgi:trimeric autotransporter adhesin